MSESNTYNLPVFCENCGYEGNLDIPKGTTVDKYSCPTCGVPSLTRDINAHLRDQSISSYE